MFVENMEYRIRLRRSRIVALLTERMSFDLFGSTNISLLAERVGLTRRFYKHLAPIGAL